MRKIHCPAVFIICFAIMAIYEADIRSMPYSNFNQLDSLIELFADTTGVEFDSTHITFKEVADSSNQDPLVDSLIRYTCFYDNLGDTLPTYDIVYWDELSLEQQDSMDFSFFGINSFEEFLKDTVGLTVGDIVVQIEWFSSDCNSFPFRSWALLSSDGEGKYDGFMYWTGTMPTQPSDTSSYDTTAAKWDECGDKIWGPWIRYGTNVFGMVICCFEWKGGTTRIVDPDEIPRGGKARFEALVDFSCSCMGACVGKQAAAALGRARFSRYDARDAGPFTSNLFIWPCHDKFLNDAAHRWTLNAQDNQGDASQSGGLTFGGIAFNYKQSITQGYYVHFLKRNLCHVDVRVLANNVTNHGIFVGSGSYVHSKGYIKWYRPGEDIFALRTMIQACVVGRLTTREYHCVFSKEILDTCPFKCLPEDTLGASLRIERRHNTHQGRYASVSITTEHIPIEMGGFDFLIAYDASALTATEVTPGQLLEDCDWEYFTYRFGVHGNCGDACPSGLLRIIALAETNDGSNHPSCYGPPDTNPHELAKMKFYVTNDRTFECQHVPIRFFWDDCGDNSISSPNGDTLYIDRTIYDVNGDLIWHEEDDDQFPEDARIPFVGAPDHCLNLTRDKPTAVRFINFINGGIDIICADSIDVRGDINLNGVPNEIADAVMFTNYFVYNLAAFGDHVEASVAASDVNADGVPLTVADLVYMVRVITADAMPYQKLSPGASKAEVLLSVNHSAVAASVNSTDDIGGGYFVFEYSGFEIGEPQLINGASDMMLKYSNEDGILKVLVYSMEEGVRIKAGAENIFVIPIEGKGIIELSEVQLSDYHGNLLTVDKSDQAVLPQHFALHQNYPNPFNTVTQIIYELPEAARVKIEIRNVMGQKVATLLDKVEEAGVHRVEWNGTSQSGEEVASGIYIYRLESEGFVATKKMTLLK